MKKLSLALIIFCFSTQLLAKPEQKQWTFLLFLNGHNNLSDFGDMNLKDMEKTGSTDEINLVVEWGKSGERQTKRLLVEKSNNPSRVTSRPILSLPKRDMGDVKNFVEFVKWGVDHYPAKRYFIAIWNHGTGWNFQDFSSGDIRVNDISYDDDTGNRITTEQLGEAMAEIKNYIGRNVDIYGSDACLMQMIEVAAEMKDSVDYFVGSQELEPAEGWPYAPFIQKWAQAPQMTPAELTLMLSKEYLKAYSDGGVYDKKNVTLSVLDMSKFQRLLDSTSHLVQELMQLDAATFQKMRTALKETQYFTLYEIKDYGDILKILSTIDTKKDLSVFERPLADLNDLVLTSDNSWFFRRATGLSIWLPLEKHKDQIRYKSLVFNRLTNWSDLIEKLQ